MNDHLIGKCFPARTSNNGKICGTRIVHRLFYTTKRFYLTTRPPAARDKGRNFTF
jgi:hypothetical protein